MTDFEDIEIDEDLLAADICKGEGGFYFFVQEFWDVIINEPPVWNWHIKYICDTLEEILFRVALKPRGKIDPKTKKDILERLHALYEYILFNVPPGSSKSTIISIMFPMWGWVVDPSLRFICSSYAGDIAVDLADKSRKIFWSEKYQRYFPHVKIDKENEAKSHFKNKSGGERYATSTGAAVTGVHAHFILIDDPQNPQQASNENERIKANDYLDNTLSTRKVDKAVTVTVIVQQRLHEDDTTGHVLETSDRVLHVCLPAEVSKYVKPMVLKLKYQDGLLDPIRLSANEIKNLRKRLGSYNAASQLDQLPSPAEGGIIKKAWFEIVKREIPPTAVMQYSIDTAYTKKQTNDPCGFFAYFMEKGIMYIAHVEEQYLEFPDLQKYLPIYVKTHHYNPKRSIIRVEPKASGHSIVQVLKTRRDLNITISEPPKDDKETRVNAIAAKIESGKVKLVFGPWNEDFLNQVGAFPNGKHDEHVDNLSASCKKEFIDNQRGKRYKRRN